MLELDRVSFSYGPKVVADAVSISVAPGELVALLGSNGAGKSTLLRIASGILAPSSGRVTLSGRDVGSYSARGLALRRAFLEQDSSVAFDCRVIDAVLLGRYAYGNFSAGRDDMRFARASLAEVGLAGFEDRLLTSLSGGERRRVMLARVLAQLARDGSCEGSVLLLDEPSAGLDPAHAHGAMSAARRLADRGAAVLAVLHDPNLAAQYAEKIAFLKGGRMLGVHSASGAMRAELLEDAYGAPCRIISDGISDFALFLRK